MKMFFIAGVFIGLLGAFIAGDMSSVSIEFKIGMFLGMIGIYFIGIATGIKEAK